MTGNQIKGKGFRGALQYNLVKVEKGIAEMLDHNFASPDKQTVLNEVRILKAERPNLQKYFYHTSINFPPHENLTNDLMTKIGREYLTLNGFTNHQYIMFRHHDADHPHMHILVNRIGFDGKVHSDSNDFARSENVLRQLEIKYNLTQVTPSKQVRERAITKDELEMMKRTNEPSGKMTLQTMIKDVLTSGQKLSTAEFVQALESKGVNVQFNQATTGYVSGISYSYEGFVTTGGKLGNNFKWNSIKASLNYEQERDRAEIHQANLRSKAAATHHLGRTSDLRRGSEPVQAHGKNISGDATASKESLRHVVESQSRSNQDTRTGKVNRTGRNKSSNHNLKLSHFLPESGKENTLATLLDSGPDGNPNSIDYQPHLDNQANLIRKKRKRKGKRLRW